MIECKTRNETFWALSILFSYVFCVVFVDVLVMSKTVGTEMKRTEDLSNYSVSNTIINFG